MTPNILSDLAAIDRYMSITRQDIIKYIPYKPGINPCTSFEILLNIYSNPKLTAHAIKKLRNSFSIVVDKNLSHLFQYGLIEPVNKPRRITQINAWKCDRAYVISKQGEGVISAIFEPVCGEKIVVNQRQSS